MVYTANWGIIYHRSHLLREPGFTPLIQWLSAHRIDVLFLLTYRPSWFAYGKWLDNYKIFISISMHGIFKVYSPTFTIKINQHVGKYIKNGSYGYGYGRNGRWYPLTHFFPQLEACGWRLCPMCGSSLGTSVFWVPRLLAQSRLKSTGGFPRLIKGETNGYS